MPKKYRDQGAVGALLDEYEKAVLELKDLIKNLSHEALTKIVDHETNDHDCRSIQTILTHVISAGYGYIIYCRNDQGEKLDKKNKELLDNIDSYLNGLDQMFTYNVQFFKDYPHVKLEEYDCKLKMKTSWGQIYDVEGIMEHAIVHILRHRRQIERFILKDDLK